MQASICIPTSLTSHSLLKPITNPLLGHSLSSRPCLPLKRRASFTTKALVSTTKESVLKDFHERRALKVHQTCQVLLVLFCSSIFSLRPYSTRTLYSCIYFPIVPMRFSIVQIISGLQNFDKENVASVITAAEQVCFTYSINR